MSSVADVFRAIRRRPSCSPQFCIHNHVFMVIAMSAQKYILKHSRYSATANTRHDRTLLHDLGVFDLGPLPVPFHTLCACRDPSCHAAESPDASRRALSRRRLAPRHGGELAVNPREHRAAITGGSVRGAFE